MFLELYKGVLSRLNKKLEENIIAASKWNKTQSWKKTTISYLYNSLLVVSIHGQNFKHTTGCEEEFLVGITSHDAHKLSWTSRCQDNQFTFLVTISQHMETVYINLTKDTFHLKRIFAYYKELTFFKLKLWKNTSLQSLLKWNASLCSTKNSRKPRSSNLWI